MNNDILRIDFNVEYNSTKFLYTSTPLNEINNIELH